MIWVMLFFLLFPFYQFPIECCPSSKAIATENLVERLLKENSVYKNAHKALTCCMNVREYVMFYEYGMLINEPHLITSEDYYNESNLFISNPKLYFRNTYLFSQVKEKSGLSDYEIDENTRLKNWTFILNYIIEQATTEELAHPGLIELKDEVIRKDTLWKGEYV